jgi:PKD repeat protein
VTTGGGAIAGLAYDFGDGSPVVAASAATATHTYAAAGTYPVTAIVTDAAGDRSLATEQVTVPYVSPSPYPTAVLTMMPATPLTTPLGMTVLASGGGMIFDAEGSAPGESPLATNPYFVRYCQGSGNAGPSAVIRLGADVPGICYANLTVTDDAGRTTTTPTTDFTVAESFESPSPDLWFFNTGGTAGITLTRVAGGHSGDYAAKLTNGNTTNTTCLLNDAPNMVPTTSAGQYTASLWVRSDSPGATLNLRVGEAGASGSTLATKTTSTTLSTDWQQVTATLPVTSPGSKLDVNAYVSKAAPGTCFYADDIAIHHG